MKEFHASSQTTNKIMPSSQCDTTMLHSNYIRKNTTININKSSNNISINNTIHKIDDEDIDLLQQQQHLHFSNKKHEHQQLQDQQHMLMTTTTTTTITSDLPPVYQPQHRASI